MIFDVWKSGHRAKSRLCRFADPVFGVNIGGADCMVYNRSTAPAIHQRYDIAELGQIFQHPRRHHPGSAPLDAPSPLLATFP